MRLPPRSDLVLGAALVALVVVETLANHDAPRPGLRAALAGLAVASVAVRRSSPVLAAAVFSGGMTAEALATESPDENGILIAILVVSYSVGRHLPRTEALLSVGLVTLALTVAIATDPSDSVSNVPLSVVLFVLVPFGLGAALRRRVRDVAALSLRTEALEDEADRAVAAERRRIARELHDVVSHAVTLVAVQAEAGLSVLDGDREAARRSLTAIGQVSREALAELARLLAVLEDEGEPGSPDAGLSQVGHLVAGARAAGLDVTLGDTGEAHHLDAAVDHCAYRVVQEGLTNALRHASDARVGVVLDRHPDRVEVLVRSLGTPHASSYGGTGRGLAGLRERVVGLGGRFEAGRTVGEEFEVRAVLPTAPVGAAGRP